MKLWFTMDRKCDHYVAQRKHEVAERASVNEKRVANGLDPWELDMDRDVTAGEPKIFDLEPRMVDFECGCRQFRVDAEGRDEDTDYPVEWDFCGQGQRMLDGLGIKLKPGDCRCVEVAAAPYVD